MFYIKKALLNAKRYRSKSLLVVLICAIIVLFLFLYIGGMQSNVRQLGELPLAMPVYARISNLNGTLYDGILIQENRVAGLEASPHVAELSYTVQLGTALGRIAEKDVPDMQMGDLTLPMSLGVNSLSTYPGLSEEDITFISGAGPELFEGDGAVCIMRERELERYKLAVGDSIWITQFYVTYPSDNPAADYKWLGEFEAKIIGSYGDTWNMDTSGPMQVLFPAKWIWKLQKQRDIMFCASSAQFRITNPLLLNDFKAEMKTLNLMSVISQALHSQRGIALTVNDGTFIRAASNLMDNIALMKTFTPLIFAGVGLVGFVVSYLLLHGRKPEIAIMRSVGMSKKGCFAMLFMENAMLDLAGSAFGILAASFFIETGAALTITVTALFFACYMAGTAAALILLGKFSVMAVLSSLE